MYDTTTRVKLVKSSICHRQRRRAKRVLRSMAALCLLLAVSLAGAVGASEGFGHTAALSMYGSILLHEEVGGYVLAGVLSFTVAVVITVLCIRYRERDKKDKKEGMRG